MGCLLTLKIRSFPFLFFLSNFGAVTDQQRKQFHQDIKRLEKRFQGIWNAVTFFMFCVKLMYISSKYINYYINISRIIDK